MSSQEQKDALFLLEALKYSKSQIVIDASGLAIQKGAKMNATRERLRVIKVRYGLNILPSSISTAARPVSLTAHGQRKVIAAPKGDTIDGVKARAIEWQKLGDELDVVKVNPKPPRAMKVVSKNLKRGFEEFEGEGGGDGQGAGLARKRVGLGIEREGEGWQEVVID